MDPLTQGRSYYKRGDYEGALEAFTEGIKISTGHIRLTALDHRAATFEKLHQLQSALRDAKEMIEMKPGLAKGYLRCAKVLQLKGEESLALKIYERGLKKVGVGSDPDRLMLQEMFGKLQKKMAPTKNFDPLVMLPTELARMICEKLGIRDRVICLAVSRPWKRFLEAYHGLWMVLDLRSSRRLVRLDSLKAHLRRSNYRLDRAFLNMNPKIFNSKHLEVLTKSCRELSFLELSPVGYLGDSLLTALPEAQNLRTLIVREAEMLLYFVVKVLGLCPRLQTVEFDHVRAAPGNDRVEWPPLHSLISLELVIWGVWDSDPLNLDLLVSCTPELRSVRLIHLPLLPSVWSYGFVEFSLWTRLEHFEFTRTRIMARPSLPPTLKYLDMSGTHFWPAHLPQESVLTINLPLLETFICDGTDFNLRHIFTLIGPSIKTGNLKALHIGDLTPSHSYEEDPQSPDDLFMPSVETLSLSNWQESEEDILLFLRRCTSLRYVDLSYTRVTGVVIKELMTRDIGPLKRLSVNGCAYLSPDAVDYARSLGTVVEYNNIPQTKGAIKKSFRDSLLASAT